MFNIDMEIVTLEEILKEFGIEKVKNRYMELYKNELDTNNITIELLKHKIPKTTLGYIDAITVLCYRLHDFKLKASKAIAIENNTYTQEI